MPSSGPVVHMDNDAIVASEPGGEGDNDKPRDHSRIIHSEHEVKERRDETGVFPAGSRMKAFNYLCN